MTQSTYIATLVSSGKRILVYKHSSRPVYVDMADCKTEYDKNQLTNIVKDKIGQ